MGIKDYMFLIIIKVVRKLANKISIITNLT